MNIGLSWRDQTQNSGNTAVNKNNDKASRTFFLISYLFEIFVPIPYAEELPPRYTGQHLYQFHQKILNYGKTLWRK